MKKYGNYFVTIGLEVHVALKTKEKLFSESTNGFELTEFSLFDAGIPGILPVISKEPVEMAVAFGLAVNAEVKKESLFERKHYFYPDLPLGYQITQQHQPILIGGKIKIKEGGENWIEIEHAHLECDAAKSIHDMYDKYTAIDLSRCASPLLEIVSMPCMHSPEEAKEYAKEIHSLVTFMGICDGKLEEGSFRVDASISLSKTDKLGARVEIKNISSFAFLQTALEYEIFRQTEILDMNQKIDVETRLFNEKDMETYSMRKKETVDEYRLMIDPDITPLVFDNSLIEDVKYKYDIKYFELREELKSILLKCELSVGDDEISGLLSGVFKEQWLDFIKDETLQTEKIVKMLAFWLPEIVVKNLSSKKLGKEDLLVLNESNLQAKECKETIEKWLYSSLDLKECMPVFISEIEVVEVVQDMLIQFKAQVEKYKSGDVKVFKFLMGKIMSELKGKAQAHQVQLIIEKILSENEV
jgi:aspartyl-tRNA(Asn)/glutamyl-tRNA(Gln) amidotransferase subunit B